jgi:hypothetical protein
MSSRLKRELQPEVEKSKVAATKPRVYDECYISLQCNWMVIHDWLLVNGDLCVGADEEYKTETRVPVIVEVHDWLYIYREWSQNKNANSWCSESLGDII